MATNFFNKPKEITVQPFQSAAVHRDLVHSVAFDYHGRRMVTCSSDKTVAIYERQTDGKWVRSAYWKAHGGAIWKAEWAHPEFGQIIATCSYDRMLTIWEEVISRDRQDYEKKRSSWIRRYVINDSRANVTDVAFAPRHLGLMLAGCNSLGSIRIYDAPDAVDAGRWTLIHELQAFHTRCGCITWSQSRLHRPMIAVGSDEKRSETTERVVIYVNVDGNRKWQRVISCKFNLPGPVTDLKFSPIVMIESLQLAIATGDVHIYNIKVSKNAVVEDEFGVIGANPVTASEYSVQKVALLGDLRKAWKLRFNVMGSMLSSTSLDGTVRSWKSMFINQWVKMADMTIDDYMAEQQIPPQQSSRRSFLSERTAYQPPIKPYY